jgi:hypothetical protein
MSNPEPEHRDLSDPTFSFADFRVQTFGGRMRWLASVLGLASLGLFAYLLTEGRNARLDFPFQIRGQAALWTVGIAFAIWFAIAVLNWMAWSKKK